MATQAFAALLGPPAEHGEPATFVEEVADELLILAAPTGPSVAPAPPLPADPPLPSGSPFSSASTLPTCPPLASLAILTATRGVSGTDGDAPEMAFAVSPAQPEATVPPSPPGKGDILQPAQKAATDPGVSAGNATAAAPVIEGVPPRPTQPMPIQPVSPPLTAPPQSNDAQPVLADPDAPPPQALLTPPQPPRHLTRSAESALMLRAADLAPTADEPPATPDPALPSAPQTDPPAPTGADTPTGPEEARDPALLQAEGQPLTTADSTRTLHPAAPRHIVQPPDLPPATIPALVQSARQTDTGTVEFILTPEDLGKLRFELTQTGEQMRIHLTVERPETLDLLRRNAEHLLAEFRQAGYAGASLSFGTWTQGGQQHTPPPDAPLPDAQPQTQTPGPPLPASPGTGLDLRL